MPPHPAARRPHRSGRLALALQGLALLMALVPGVAAAQEPGQPASAQSAPAAPFDGTLYLHVFINGFDRKLIVPVEQREGRLHVDAGELAAVGIRIEDLPLDASQQIALDGIPGLHHAYDIAMQRLDLTVPEARLKAQFLGGVSPEAAPPESGTGLVLDYSMRLQDSRVSFDGADARSTQSAHLVSNFRVFSPYGLFINYGHATLRSDQSDYVRDDTYWTSSDPLALQSYTVGDYTSGSLAWTRAMRLGGLRIARRFDLRPDLVTFPLPELGGSAVVPSAVDLYINGSRQFSGTAEPGPFVITQPPALTGAGTAAIVYRDALGREITTTLPMYVDTRMLAEGLVDYSLEIGYPRHNYGLESFDYGSTPVASASWRYGASNILTLEAHGEAGRRLGNLGVGALVQIGQLGVASASIAGSGGEGYGAFGRLGYQYRAQRWNVDLEERVATRKYRDLGSLEGASLPRRNGHALVGVQIGDKHSAALSHVTQKSFEGTGSGIVSGTWNSNLGGSRASVFTTLFRDVERKEGLGVFAGLRITFDDRTSAYATLNRSNGANRVEVGATRPVDYDLGGFGWRVGADSTGENYRRGLAQLDYRNRYGDWAVALERTRYPHADFTDASLYGAGSVVWMAGEVIAARAVYDGFALVSTSGVPDVPVLRENRMLGRTDANGYLLVPDLPSYRSSRIAIDTLGLPADARIPTDRMLANPRERSGLLVEFPIERYLGASLVLIDAASEPLPPGTPVVLLDTQARAVTGYDGLVFFPALQPRNRIEAQTERGACSVEVSFSPGQAMQTLGPFRCEPQ